MRRKALLNHAGNGDVTITSYIKLSLAQKTRAAEQVADYISGKIIGTARDKAKALPESGWRQKRQATQ
jgi:hypothetical protein